MEKNDIDKRIDEIEKRKKLLEAERELALEEASYKSVMSNNTRARSITVGTAFGGVTEISMRGEGDAYLWTVMQPVEVTELIHQLAGNIGCHINIQPRKDFASWRAWKEPDPNERLHLNGWPPFGNDMAPHHQIGANLPPPDKQPGLDNNINKVDDKNEPLAITKTINKRKSKRAPTST